ncbi:MAG: hypothetical protein L6R41_002605 [Letrouitia leprolyta]|nr:MAG: hypothetical protein L6R41_002605 [Letrouitia leprolyta]
MTHSRTPESPKGIVAAPPPANEDNNTCNIIKDSFYASTIQHALIECPRSPICLTPVHHVRSHQLLQFLLLSKIVRLEVMSAGRSSLWKVRDLPRGTPTLLLPPLFALALYLFTTYVFIPFYRRYRARNSYSTSNLFRPLTDRISNNLHIPSFFSARRRNSTGSGDSLLGDEELEEGFDVGGRGGRERERGQEGDGGGVGERLSLELERGFKDESDESEEEGRGRGRATEGRR